VLRVGRKRFSVGVGVMKQQAGCAPLEILAGVHRTAATDCERDHRSYGEGDKEQILLPKSEWRLRGHAALIGWSAENSIAIRSTIRT
jgi:hypothetical protein